MPSPVGSAVGANLPTVRDHNSALVLDLVRGGEGISRVELAARTGLTAQAITKIVNRLLAEGLLVEAGRGSSTGGKPRIRLKLDPDARRAVGVHLDRDAATIVLSDLAGRPVARRQVQVGMDLGPERALNAVAEHVRALLVDVEPGRVVGVGVACPGPLDHADGVLHRVTGQPAWDGFALRSELSTRLGRPVVLDKDTNAIALGECLIAPSQGGEFAFLFHGTGLGAGLVLDGRLRRGPRTNAGEFGHQVVQVDGPPCWCGGRGCLEALCRQAVAAGDVAGAARLVGIAAASLVRLLDVERIVLGGPVVLAGPEIYLQQVAAAIRTHLPEPDWQQVTVVVTAAGEDGAALGAAWLMLGPLYGRVDGLMPT